MLSRSDPRIYSLAQNQIVFHLEKMNSTVFGDSRIDY